MCFSLKDLNLSAHLSELVEVGIDSFQDRGTVEGGGLRGKCHELLLRPSG